MISVCIATYNGEKYIKQQLDSILCQLKDDDEIIISDDNSTDGTLLIVESFKDSRIKIYPGNEFHSPIFNFENALKKAKGNYIFLCDQDDVWLSNKVSLMMDYLCNYDLVVSDCKIVDADLNIINESFFHTFSSGKGFCKNLIKNTYLGCCMAFKSEVLNYVLPFPKRIAMHDIWIGLSVELFGSVYFLDQPLIFYRRHGKNASFGGGKSHFSISYRIRYRIILLYLLLRRKYCKL